MSINSLLIKYSSNEVRALVVHKAKFQEELEI